MTVLQKTQEKMQALREQRTAELAEIQKKQDEAEAQKISAEQKMKAATIDINVDEYEAAKYEENRARIAIEMLGARYGMIQKKELISEADSDAIIDDLLSYENKLSEDFKAAIVKPLRVLADLNEKYMKEIRDTENTLRVWQQDIHPNYRTFGATMYKDPETGETTDRSSSPVPVHRIPYTGCNEAEILRTLMGKLPASMFEE